MRQNRDQFTGTWTNVLIMVGANDLGYTDEHEVMTDLHSIISELQELNSNADVDLCEILPRRKWTRDDVPSSQHPNEHAIKFNTLLHRDFPGRVVKLFGHFARSNGDAECHLFKKDGLHPRPEQAPFLEWCMMEHLNTRPRPEFYESWPMPQFNQPEVLNSATPLHIMYGSSPTEGDPESYSSNCIIPGTGEVYSLGNSTKVDTAKEKEKYQHSQFEVPTFLCGVVIGKVSKGNCSRRNLIETMSSSQYSKLRTENSEW